MSAEHGQNSIKKINITETVIAENYPDTVSFRDKQGYLTTLRQPQWRIAGNNEVRPGDFITLPYYHPEKKNDILPPEISKNIATDILTGIKNYDLTQNAIGIELEGSLYSKDGRRLLPKYDGIHFTPETDLHPESTDSIIEVATGILPDGRYPSNPVETSYILAETVLRGHEIAGIRDGIFVIASAPEGADSTQVRITQHPYILQVRANKTTQSTAWEKDIPQETLALYEQTGETETIAFHASHIHTGNPKLPTSGLYDPRIALAKGLLRLTQLNKISSLMLYNTHDYLGHHIEGITDTRALLRRKQRGTHDADIPHNAYDFFHQAQLAVENGDIHSFSRYPVSGQHDRLRIKEFGTTEDTDSPANPDLRLVLAKTFFNQLTEIPVYEALEQVGGDESKVIAYLQKKYGDLFTIIPTLRGNNSSFQQDLLFNKERFSGKVQGKTLAEQFDQAKSIIRRIGKEYPVFKTQATIVDHVFTEVTKPPQKGLDLDEYMSIESGLNPGILTDYLSPVIEENIFARADGSRKQSEALLQVRDEKDLLAFFGIKSKDSVTLYSRQ